MTTQGATYISSYETEETLDSTTITVTDPDDQEVITDATPTTISTGNYSYSYKFADNATLGTWIFTWNLTIDGETTHVIDIVEVTIRKLLTVDEVREEAATESRNVDLSSYSDAQLEKKINIAQAEIEEQSGRYFSETNIQETKFRQKGNSILLNNHPIKSVELLKIDGSEADVTEDMVNLNSGIIYLTSYGLNFEYTAYIEYTAGETEGNSFIKASDICMDIFFINLNKTSDGKYIKSEKDSNYSVTYGDEDPQKVKGRLINSLIRPSIASI